MIREKKIYCGEKYLEVDIYTHYDFRKKNGKRSKKKKESLPCQRNLNDKNAKRKLIQLVESNFTDKDYFLTLTYNDEFLPNTLEKAQKEVENYLRRLKNRRIKENVEELKYIVITAFTPKKEKENENINKDEDTEVVRVHHHLLVNGGIDRDILEELWSKGRGKNKKRMGYANPKRLQPDPNTGLAAIAGYMIKQPTNKRRWSSSQNLERPYSRTNDYKYSRKKIQSIVGNQKDLSYWEEQYPGYYIADKENGYEEVHSDLLGWSIYLKLRKKE